MLFFFEHFGMAGEETFHIHTLYNEPFPAHLHRAYELIYVKDGKLSLQVEQKKYSLETGQLAFVFGNQIHSFTLLTSNWTEVLVLIFSPEIITDFNLEYKDFVPANNIILMPKWLDFCELNSTYQRKGALYNLCDILLSATEMEPIGNTVHSAVLQQLFLYIDKNYQGESCSLKNAAETLQYDYTYLSKLFSKSTGINFTVYLNNFRIAKACTMLHNKEMTISKIADRCGYMNLRTFHRNFLKIMNCTPQVYLSQTKRLLL